MSQRTLAVIDGNSLIHRAFHAVQAPMSGPDGTPTNACFGFMSMLLKLVEDFRPDAIVCAWDVHRPDWRMKLLERYKAQRPPMDQALAVQFPLIKGLLESMGIPCVSMEGFEGDDILGTVARMGEEKGYRVYLVTGDKDAYQLSTQLTSIVTNRKGMTDVAVMTPADVEERYGVRPDQVPDFLGLKGDPSDNIPGVPGIGPKKAADLIAKYGTLEAVLEDAPNIKGKMGENLREHAEDARISRAVATIRRDAPVEIDLDSLVFPSFEAAAVTDAFGALHFNKHLRDVLTLLGEGGAGQAAAAPAAQLGFEPAASAAALIEAAVEAGLWVGAALQQPEGDDLFSACEQPQIAFANGTQLALAPLDEALPLLMTLLERGRLAAMDVKALVEALRAQRSAGGCPVLEGDALPALLGALDAAVTAQGADDARVFDCSLAAYLLDSARSSYAAAELALDYLGASQPQGDGAPSQGAFEAAAAQALVEPLAQAVAEDGSQQLLYSVELPLMAVLARMEHAGCQLDCQLLQQMSSQLGEQIDDLRTQIFQLAGEEFNVNSPKQLGTILFEKLGLDVRKTKKTKTGYSTNEAVLQKLAQDHPLPEKILQYRELAKLRSTYLDALPKLVDPADGRVHTTFNQTVTATGRLSSSDPNLQNIPVRTELGRRIREAFVVPQGWVFVSADYSQIELRLLAHLSGDEGLVSAFNSNADFHAATASMVFGVPVEEVTPEQRSRAKAVNFGIVYGQQAFGLGQSLHIPLAEAQEMIDRYYAAYPGVGSYLDATVAQARETGYAETMFGRKRHIPDIHAKNPNLRSFGERTAMNHPMQGSAADIIKMAMIAVERRLQDEGFKARMVLQVHDELDFECPLEELDRLKAMVVEVMDNVVQTAAPMRADVGVGDNWAQAH
ncbi:MAG: DNA polymerase I [Coriobacteriales bacterium]